MAEDFEARVTEDLKLISRAIGDIKVTLAVQAGLLAEHIRRTEAAEAHLAKFETEMVPIKQHVALWGSLGKLLTAATAIGGLVVTVMKLLGK
jgi:hypothetical protein